MSKTPYPRTRLALLAGSCIAMTATPARAGVSVGFDVAALNELLPAMTVNEVTVPLGEANSLKVNLKELKVLGFDPGSGGDGSGHILASVRLQVPQLGIEAPVKPRLSFRVIRGESGSTLELRFEEVRLSIPVVGAIDVAPFLAPLYFPADNVFLVGGMQGDIRVHSRLSGVEMGLKVLRFEFDLETLMPGER